MTTTDEPARDRRRSSRWSAPLSALGALFILGCADWYYGFGQMTFLEVPGAESSTSALPYARASAHASGAADGILLFATAIVVIAGVLGTIRPRRGTATAIFAFTVSALVTIWLATRADIHTVYLYRR
ncbi:MAG: hypothetical protein M0Z51_16255 [Propionibacterium sp.]|nr:hypothetical protein [Propionibacterium sp.]